MIADGNNCWTITEDRIADALSELAEFQAWGGAANATDALSLVTFDELPEPADHEAETESERAALPNRVMITSAESGGFRLSRDATPERWSPSGSVEILFERFVNDEDYDTKRAAIQRAEKNHIGSIMIAFWDYVRNNGLVTPGTIAVTFGPSFNDRAEHGTRGEVLMTEIEIEWARQ